MGLLSLGKPFSYEDTKKYTEHVKEHGIEQFINCYKKFKDREGDVFKWGDEVEYNIVKFFDDKKEAKASLRGTGLLSILKEKELANPNGLKSLWTPEYGEYMIEGTPAQPYEGLMAHFNTVEANMKCRREELSQLLERDEAAMTITCIPRLGCEDFTHPHTKPTPNEGPLKSLFYPDDAICIGHPRYRIAARNIKERRGEHVAINIPIFKDIRTKIPVDDSSKYRKAALPDHIYLDAMGFGMGLSCLQVTFQACNLQEARTIYDQLTPLTPIMLALTAASPIHRGFLTDVDCRWNVIAGSVDCRTEEERGLKPLQENKFLINKSRYDSVDTYISPEGEKYNDIPLVYHEEYYQKLVDGGVDHLIARHVAHLFIRDVVVLYAEKLHQNDEEERDHFENINSTNWQTMRFKPPPPASTTGWRVEFRPCEIQVTDFENAAICCFVALLTRVILSYKINFLIPISKVEENMKNAQKRNAIREQTFWFRKNVSGYYISDNCNTKQCDEFVLMNMDEIINGKEGTFPGLIPLMNSYLNDMEVDADTHCTIQQYLKFIQQKASGELLTTASWMRKFVTEHPDYRQDSVVSEKINYDLLRTLRDIQNGTASSPLLLGPCNFSKTQQTVPTALS
ncbi:hypothetical protein JTB14_030012 [Gonioctena quinquepunctata]|nr:hypothetical protein JTB14_030012 [Gonioctena quinquepunctata]